MKKGWIALIAFLTVYLAVVLNEGKIVAIIGKNASPFVGAMVCVVFLVSRYGLRKIQGILPGMLLAGAFVWSQSGSMGQEHPLSSSFGLALFVGCFYLDRWEGRGGDFK